MLPPDEPPSSALGFLALALDARRFLALGVLLQDCQAFGFLSLALDTCRRPARGVLPCCLQAFRLLSLTLDARGFLAGRFLSRHFLLQLCLPLRVAIWKRKQGGLGGCFVCLRTAELLRDIAGIARRRGDSFRA